MGSLHIPLCTRQLASKTMKAIIVSPTPYAPTHGIVLIVSRLRQRHHNKKQYVARRRLLVLPPAGYAHAHWQPTVLQRMPQENNGGIPIIRVERDPACQRDLCRCRTATQHGVRSRLGVRCCRIVDIERTPNTIRFISRPASTTTRDSTDSPVMMHDTTPFPLTL